MRNYCDIDIVAATQQFGAAMFCTAFEKTSAKRKTSAQAKGAKTAIKRISENKP
jgi:hypothetical protein